MPIEDKLRSIEQLVLDIEKESEQDSMILLEALIESGIEARDRIQQDIIFAEEEDCNITVPISRWKH
jgi:hypothetical protein